MILYICQVILDNFINICYNNYRGYYFNNKEELMTENEKIRLNLNGENKKVKRSLCVKTKQLEIKFLKSMENVDLLGVRAYEMYLQEQA